MSNLADLGRMVRPWYRGIDANGFGSPGDHIYADCEWLAEEGEPREGVGWLDPDGDMCEACRRRYDPETYHSWSIERGLADEY